MAVRQLILTTTVGPTTLQRVVATCARRSCAITALRWEQRGGVGRLSLEVSGARYHVERLGRWLGTLVDVLEVVDAEPVPGGSDVAVRPA